METKMQTSFIPKKPIVESRPEGSGISLFTLLAVIIFIVSLALAGGVWLLKGSLVTKIEKDKEALVAAKASYEEGTINPLIRLDDRIKVSGDLLSKHLAISPVFLLLEKNTLKNVRIKTFKFTHAGKDQIKIDLTGTAQSYEALSKQSDAFGAESLREFISQPIVSDFSPTPEGTISFTFSALVNSNLISYSSLVPTNTQ
jgi:hypothetical protein